MFVPLKRFLYYSKKQIAMGALLTSAIIAFTILIVFLLNFYRDPERKIPPGNSIVSPADGKIMRIDMAEKGRNFIKKGHFGKIESLADSISNKCFIISIFMSPLDVHINRSPVPGNVVSVKHTPGKYFAAFNLKKSLMNEKNEIIIKNSGIGKIKVIQIAGFLARRIICTAKKGDKLFKGQKIGKIVLGSQVTLIIPFEKVNLKVKKGQKVTGGKTIIAEY